MAFSHKGSDKAGELKGVAVIGDGKGGFCRGKLVEFSDVGVEFRHGGPDFMRTELFQDGAEIAICLFHAR